MAAEVAKNCVLLGGRDEEAVSRARALMTTLAAANVLVGTQAEEDDKIINSITVSSCDLIRDDNRSVISLQTKYYSADDAVDEEGGGDKKKGVPGKRNGKKRKWEVADNIAMTPLVFSDALWAVSQVGREEEE